jgi:hypothetical protein
MDNENRAKVMINHERNHLKVIFQLWAIFSVVNLIATGWPSAQTHAKTVCPPIDASPTVTVRIQPGKVTLNNARSQNGLLQLHRREMKMKRAMGWNPVGLTSTELGFSMKVRINAKPIRQGKYCGFLDSVNASIGYSQLTVYVARNYRPGSCHYASIMEHEKLHVLVFRRALQRYAPRIEHRLKRVAAGLRPVVTSTPERAATHLKNKLRQEVRPLFREMNRELNRNNAKLDTPENYKREQARCSNW